MEKIIIESCMQGEVKPLSESKDEAFANKLSGDGVLLTPTSNRIIAPFDGKVVIVFATKHAIILRSNEGLAFVIHIGIESEKLCGDGFDVKVQDGQTIKKGDLLMEIDAAYLTSIHYNMDTHLLFPSLGIRQLVNVHYGKIDFLDSLCGIQ
ncbi:MAG: PTS glucose transporter subunit IIA [Erysipelotrichia bacterium]|nr:PTS glucose transporter subunit IIA [Erysipelotrichia bacterium]